MLKPTVVVFIFSTSECLKCPIAIESYKFGNICPLCVPLLEGIDPLLALIGCGIPGKDRHTPPRTPLCTPPKGICPLRALNQLEPGIRG